jgi:GH24 family phage-related lysozyme (muramidase)
MYLLSDLHTMTSSGIAYLKKLEGLRLQPYPDGNGWSIGYGHFIMPGEEWMMAGITKDQADAIFSYDLYYAEQAVSDTITATGSPQFYDGLMMFAFNIGADNFKQSQLAALVNDPTKTDAQIRMLWNNTWVGSPPKQTLLDRRQNEINYAYTSIDPDQIVVTGSKSSSWLWLAAAGVGIYLISKS